MARNLRFVHVLARMQRERAISAVAAILAVLLWIQSSPSGAASQDWPMYGHDASRSGADTSQTSFAPPSVQWTTVVDGPVYAEPLYFNNQVVVANGDSGAHERHRAGPDEHLHANDPEHGHARQHARRSGDSGHLR